MNALRGLSAFPITPSNDAGVVDVGALKALLQPLVEARVDSIGLLGSTGSYPYLAREERRRAIEAAVGLCGSTPVVVSTGALRTDDALKLALISMDSTMRSNLGVGLPIDVLVVRSDVCDADLNHRIEAGEPYFHDLRARWSAALRAAHQNIPRPPYGDK
jgi:hypothetical protein